MITKTWITAVIALLFLGILGCGGLRYSEVSPEARDFHPRRVAVLPADTSAFAEAKSDVDRLFAEVLSEQKWFADVVGGEAIGRRMESDETFRQVITVPRWKTPVPADWLPKSSGSRPFHPPDRSTGYNSHHDQLPVEVRQDVSPRAMLPGTSTKEPLAQAHPCRQP